MAFENFFAWNKYTFQYFLLKFQTKITEIMDFCLLVYLFDDDDDEVEDEDVNECFIEKKS